MTFVKGQVLTHKRTGRPKGFKGMAKLIQKETRNGAELVEYALKVFRDEEQYHHTRWEALQWLADRGFGRAMQMVDLAAHLEVSGTIEHRPMLVDALKKLEGADRARLRELMLKASGDPRPLAQRLMDGRPADAEVIDVDGGE